MRQAVIRRLVVVVLLAGFAAGCGQREPARPTDPSAAKRELNELNKARQKEWNPKK